MRKAQVDLGHARNCLPRSSFVAAAESTPRRQMTKHGSASRLCRSCAIKSASFPTRLLPADAFSSARSFFSGTPMEPSSEMIPRCASLLTSSSAAALLLSARISKRKRAAPQRLRFFCRLAG
eukprot:scaffold1437_cov268-Pinguiococcus_pyrenoidosus.AAC.6